MKILVAVKRVIDRHQLRKKYQQDLFQDV